MNTAEQRPVTFDTIRERLAADGYKQPDERDRAIIAERAALFAAHTTPRTGDFVTFADGTERRISHLWEDGSGWDGAVQTSDGGSYYLGNGYMSMSGSLYCSVPIVTLKLTDEMRLGNCWIFHHDFPGAGNGIDTQIPCRVWDCSLPAPKR